MALQAVLHFKDGTTGTIASGANARIDGDLFRVLDAGTPVANASTLAIAPLADVEYVEFLS